MHTTWKSLALAVAATCILTTSADAHFLWLDCVGEDQKHAALFFSEGPDDREYHLPESIAAADVYVRDAEGERKKLQLVEPSAEEFIGLKSVEAIAAGNTLETTCQYGVYHGTLLTYYAKHIVGSVRTAPTQPPKERKLDIVPQIDSKQVACTVYWQGKPAAGVNVTFIHPSGEQAEAETNDRGVAEFEPAKEQGLVAFLAGRDESGVTGDLNGEAYRGAMNFASLTMRYDPTDISTPEQDVASASSLPLLPEGIASFGAAVADDWLYVYGGHTGRAHAHSRENHSMMFGRVDLAKGGQWQPLPLPLALQGLAMAAHDGKLYRVGGVHSRNAPGEDADMHSTDAFAAYDPATGEWTDLPSLPSPRSSHDAIVLDGKLYVVGGWTLAGEPNDAWQQDALVYDLAQGAAGQWTTLTQPPFLRRALALAAYDGRLWAIGGLDDYGDVASSVYIFDPQTNEWSEGPSITDEGMRGFGAAAWGTPDGLFVAPADGAVYRLEETVKEWTKVAEVEVPRFFHRLMPGPDGSLLVIAGASMGDGHMPNIEVVRPDPAAAE